MDMFLKILISQEPRNVRVRQTLGIFDVGMTHTMSMNILSVTFQITIKRITSNV